MIKQWRIFRIFPLDMLIPLIVLLSLLVACKNESIATNSKFLVNPILCRDDEGPNCSKLRLGDDFFTTARPAKGFLYSCDEKNPEAPGSIESKITWINWTDRSWDFLKKMWLPQGEFVSEEGTYHEIIMDGIRHIETNSLPLDGEIGDWPMTKYPNLSQIDPNPGIPAPANFSFSYNAESKIVSTPTCVSLGAIGVAINGVVLFNAADARGEDAVAREIVDKLGGHPARTDYHYHFIPEHLDVAYMENGHSKLVGFINDGFPIYGYRGENGVEMSNADLDLCHGHDHSDLGYHYHATIEYPYTVGCYKGAPTVIR